MSNFLFFLGFTVLLVGTSVVAHLSSRTRNPDVTEDVVIFD